MNPFFQMALVLWMYLSPNFELEYVLEKERYPNILFGKLAAVNFISRILMEISLKKQLTRFKGLGEISPDEFKGFIGEDIRLSPVILETNTSIEELLSYFMGKNTPDRQKFIIENLKIEKDELEEAAA